jgi:hypothetical protein
VVDVHTMQAPAQHMPHRTPDSVSMWSPVGEYFVVHGKSSNTASASKGSAVEAVGSTLRPPNLQL